MTWWTEFFFSEHYSLSPSVTISPNILSSTIDVMVLLTNSFAKQNTKNLRDFSTDERPSASHVVLCSMMLVVTGFWLPLTNAQTNTIYYVVSRRIFTWKINIVILLTLILLTWRIWWAPNNASKWQMGFNSAFRGLNRTVHQRVRKTNLRAPIHIQFNLVDIFHYR